MCFGGKREVGDALWRKNWKGARTEAGKLVRRLFFHPRSHSRPWKYCRAQNPCPNGILIVVRRGS